jgi:hypothetical protein
MSKKIRHCTLPAAAVVAAGLLTFAPSAAAVPHCTTFGIPGKLTVMQNDGWTVQLNGAGQQFQGPVTATNGRETIAGSSAGGVNGSDLNVNVNWNNGHQSRYYGVIFENGSVPQGYRENLRGGADSTVWHTAPGSLECAESADVPAPNLN